MLSPRPLGRNSAKANIKSLQLETRRVEALEKIASASEAKLLLFKEYAESLRQENFLKLVSIKINDLDETSASLITLQKEKLLARMRAESIVSVTESELTYTDYVCNTAGVHDVQVEGHEEWLHYDDEDDDDLI